MNTESINQNSIDIDKKSTLEMVEIINREDQTVALSVKTALPSIATVIDAIVPKLRQGGRLFYTGAGTSGRLAIQDAAECTVTYGVPAGTVSAIMAGGNNAVFAPAENVEDNFKAGAAAIAEAGITERDAVIGISASGNASYVCGALTEAEKRGAETVALLCNEHGKIAECAHYVICVPTGAEVISGSTRMKAGTAQKLVLNTISTVAMIKLGKVTGNFMTWMSPTNEKLKKRAAFIVAQVCHIPEETATKILEQTQYNIQKAIAAYREETYV